MKPPGLPPARYRIEERAGRLVTIDTWAEGGGAPIANTATVTPQVAPRTAASPASAPSVAARPAAPIANATPAPARYGKKTVDIKQGVTSVDVTTRAWYDDRAPRLLRFSWTRLLLSLMFDRIFLVVVVVTIVLAINLFIPLIVLMLFPPARRLIHDQFRRFVTWRIDALGELE